MRETPGSLPGTDQGIANDIATTTAGRVLDPTDAAQYSTAATRRQEEKRGGHRHPTQGAPCGPHAAARHDLANYRDLPAMIDSAATMCYDARNRIWNDIDRD
jgi:hypothetical protein